MKKMLGVVLMLSFILGSVPKETAAENNPAPKYLFKVSYENYAWGFAYNGSLIDELGNIYSYSCTEESRKAAGANPSDEDLIKHCSDGNPRGQVDIKELQEMYKLALTLNPKNYIDGPQMYDAGITQYTAYKKDSNRVESIKLQQEGDQSGANASPDARKIVEWLARVMNRKIKMPASAIKTSLPPYLFQVAYKRHSDIKGYLIDQQGNIFYYDCAKRRFKPKQGWSDSEENLIKNCAYPKKPKGKVDTQVLHEMYNVSLALDPKDFIVDAIADRPDVKIKPDLTQVGFFAFRMNGMTKTVINLRKCKLGGGKHISPDAKKITDWLTSVTDSFGCAD